MKQITHILFDLGNTLVYFSGNREQVFDRALAACAGGLADAGVSVDRAGLIARLGEELNAYYVRREQDQVEHTTLHLLRSTLVAMGHPIYPEDVLESGLNAFYRVTQAAWVPEPGVELIVRSLFERGYRMAVLSNAAYDPDPVRQVEDAGLRPYMDFVLTSAAFGRRKPHRSIFDHALKTWPAEAASTVMVGDTFEADILGAQGAGIRSIWVTRRVEPAGQDQTVPDAVISDLKELKSIFPKKI